MVEINETQTAIAEAMNLRPGLVVQELGWDDDVDEDFRDLVMDAIDADMIEDAEDSVDAVVLWWREDDGDPADGFLDALRDLSAQGTIWFLTPKVGRPGHVEASAVQEAATTVGLVLTSAVAVSSEWHASRLVRSGARK